MSRHLLTLLGLALIAIGFFERGWLLLSVWLGCDFLVLGIAHGCGAHRIFGKRSDGSLPVWSWMVFLPLLLYTNAVWRVARMLSREPAHNKVTDTMPFNEGILAGGALRHNTCAVSAGQHPENVRHKCPFVRGANDDPLKLRKCNGSRVAARRSATDCGLIDCNSVTRLWLQGCLWGFLWLVWPFEPVEKAHMRDVAERESSATGADSAGPPERMMLKNQ